MLLIEYGDKYASLGKKVVYFKPSKDFRDGCFVKSRMGSQRAALQFRNFCDISDEILEKYDIFLVDEIHMVSFF